MKKRNIIIILIFLSTSLCFGQESNNNVSKEWQIEVGYQNFRMLDKNASPLIYVSNNGCLDFRFQKRTSQKIWSIGTSLSVGNNQSKRFGQRRAVVDGHTSITGDADSSVYVINPAISFVEAGLAYSYFWKLNTNKLNVFIGGQVKENFYYSGLGADTWFFNQLSILPVCRLIIFDEQKSKIETEIAVPVFSYLVRQPYTLDPSLPVDSYFWAYLKTGSHVSSLNDLQKINFRLNYFHQISERKTVGLSYKFMWMNYGNISDRNLKAYSNSLSVTYIF